MVVLIGYQRNLFILGLLDDLYAIKGGRWVLADIEVRLTTTQATNLSEVECWNLRLVLGLLHTVRAIHQGPISLWVHGYIHGTMHKGHHSSNVQSPLGGYTFTVQ